MGIRFSGLCLLCRYAPEFVTTPIVCHTIFHARIWNFSSEWRKLIKEPSLCVDWGGGGDSYLQHWDYVWEEAYFKSIWPESGTSAWQFITGISAVVICLILIFPWLLWDTWPSWCREPCHQKLIFWSPHGNYFVLQCCVTDMFMHQTIFIL